MAQLILPVTDNQRHALGSIAVSYAALDGAISFLIWEYSAKNQRLGQILTSGMSFRQKLDVLSALGREVLKSATFEKLDNLVKRSQNVSEKRNGLFHGQFAPSGDKNKVGIFKYRVDRKNGLSFDHSERSDSELVEFRQEIDNLVNGFTAILFVS